MRNWNKEVYKERGSSWLRVCSQPMRNWNYSFRRQLGGKFPFVCSQPMRNWNQGQVSVIHEIYFVCSQPMRNWNTQYSAYTTLPNSFVANLWGIETPLNIFISIWSFVFVANLWGIETALSFELQPSVVLVCSQPMRNWNTLFTSWRAWSAVWFVANLWGIETRQRRSRTWTQGFRL